MIRINLLPFRAARKKENLRRQISIYFLSVILMVSAMAYFYTDLNRTGSDLETRKAAKEEELAGYAHITGEIRKMKKKIAAIRSKLEVIEQLEKKKTGPVQMLREIAAAVPKDRLWLQSLEERNGIVTLKGTAMDHDTVALFMSNLENGRHIVSVDLSSTRLRRLNDYKVNVSDFVLNCKTRIYLRLQDEKEQEQKRKKT
jgi:type IV pilus assembly protein PilN